MGGLKPLHPYQGRPLVESVIRALKPQSMRLALNVGTQNSGLFIPLSSLNTGLPLIYDEREVAERGPLSGVLSALKWARSEGQSHVFTCPCDMPELGDDVVLNLVSALQDQHIIYYKGKRDHPLCALWSVRVIEPLETALRAVTPNEGLAVMRFMKNIDFSHIPIVDETQFLNLNKGQTT